MGIKDSLIKASKFVEEKTKQGIDKIKEEKDKFEAKQEEKKLQKLLELDLEKAFLANCLEYKVVTEMDKKAYVKKVDAITDYDKKTLTLYGEVDKLVNSYFVDKQNQKFVIKMIRQKQSISLTVNDIIYTRPVTIIDFNLFNDEKTKQEIIKIVNNSIQITDSKIIKSSIGNE